MSEQTGEERYANDNRVAPQRVTFGLQTAALAGFAVSTPAVAIGLAGVFDGSAADTTYTTCSKAGGLL